LASSSATTGSDERDLSSAAEKTFLTFLIDPKAIPATLLIFSCKLAEVKLIDKVQRRPTLRLRLTVQTAHSHFVTVHVKYLMIFLLSIRRGARVLVFGENGYD
jgi:hypothetical protein